MGCEKSTTCWRTGVMNIAAEIRSMRPEVSEPISAENCIGSICTAKPEVLPTALTISAMKPSMVLVLVSRKVKGLPVGVAPTLSTAWADAWPPQAMVSVASSKAPRREAGFIVGSSLKKDRMPCGAWMGRPGVLSAGWPRSRSGGSSGRTCDRPQDGGAGLAGVAPPARHVAAVAKTVAGLQLEQPFLHEQIELALDDVADLFALVREKQVVAGGAARIDHRAVHLNATRSGRRRQIFLVDTFVAEVDAPVRAGTRHCAFGLAFAVPGVAHQRFDGQLQFLRQRAERAHGDGAKPAFELAQQTDRDTASPGHWLQRQAQRLPPSAQLLPEPEVDDRMDAPHPGGWRRTGRQWRHGMLCKTFTRGSSLTHNAARHHTLASRNTPGAQISAPGWHSPRSRANPRSRLTAPSPTPQVCGSDDASGAKLSHRAWRIATTPKKSGKDHPPVGCFP